MKEYYIVLESSNGTQVNSNDYTHIVWTLNRALKRGTKVCLHQFNYFSNTTDTGFSNNASDGYLLRLHNISNQNSSYVSQSSDKPKQCDILACIPNDVIYNPDQSEKLTASYEPYNELYIELDNNEIFQIEIQLVNDTLQNITLSNINWSVVLKIIEQ